MAFSLNDATSLLSRTPAALDALLRDLPDSWTERNEGEHSWTVRDVVAHLAQLERSDWMPRLRRVLEFGETRPFDPVDREAFLRASEGKSLSQLLDEFSLLRAKNLRQLRLFALEDEDFSRRGVHPALGPVTVSELLATWTAHDMTHLHQIARILAHQYRDAVGPWGRYLGVMQCSGHSASA